MRASNPFGVIAVAMLGILAASPASATFHLMQIEQIIGGVSGDTSAQAIQLRMRSGGQHLVGVSRVVAWDAAGANPVIVCNLPANLAGPSSTGDRILLSTAAFNSLTTPAAVPDFPMTTPIPASYLAAGSLTFEHDGGSVYWRVSWGGASYTGSTTGLTDNDADGNFGPPYADVLPSDACYALEFQGTDSAPSTNNAAQYMVIDSAPSTFVNYSDQSFALDDCAVAVPATSTWGLLALALLIGCAASAMITRRATA